MNPKFIFKLFYKDVLLEWRQKYAFNGILLYVFSTIYIIQLGFQNTKINTGIWITLFWIVVLFSAVNAVAKSFLQEGRGRMLYYYTLSSAENIILAKFAYNSLLLLLLSLVSFFGFEVIFGDVMQNTGYFLIVLMLGSTGFAATFTMISAIAGRASGSATLMTVLSFPIIIPQLMLLIKLSLRAAEGYSLGGDSEILLSLGAINVIVLVVSYLLFPYLWRD